MRNVLYIGGALAFLAVVVAVSTLAFLACAALPVFGTWLPGYCPAVASSARTDSLARAQDRRAVLQEQLHVLERELLALGPCPAARYADLAVFTDARADGSDCAFCPEMVVIPAGEFTMGSPPDEEDRADNEGPQREVRVPRFALGRHEVTFAQYDACVEAGGCAERPDDEGWGRGDRPVINVLWDDAQAYVAWLREATGQPYRLPSEAEWEFAARAGTTTPFSTGATISTSEANYNGNYTYGSGVEGEYRQQTLPVGSFDANPWGLFEMHGNVWEWVEDCWHDNYRGAPTDGAAWLEADGGNCSLRVLRGGSWGNYPRLLRSAYRLRLSTVLRSRDYGFRVARTLTP